MKKKISMFIAIVMIISMFSSFASADIVGSILFQEDFENGSTNWTPLTDSRCSIVQDGTNNVYQITAPANATEIVWAGDKTWTNYRVSAKVNPQTAQCSLIARYTDANNFVMARFTGTNSIELYKWEKGTGVKLLTATFAFNTKQWYTMDIDVMDNFASLYIDGVSIFGNADIGTVNAKGAIGARAYSSTMWIDDIKVNTLTKDPADTAIYSTQSTEKYSETGTGWADSTIENYDQTIKTRASSNIGDTATWSSYANNLEAGKTSNYFIYAWMPPNNTSGGLVSYTITTLNGTWYKSINQTSVTGSWVLLATVTATGDTAITVSMEVINQITSYATAVKFVKTMAAADAQGVVGGGVDLKTVSIMLNQTGFDIGSSKRATITNVPDDTDFYVKKVGTNEVAFTGKVSKYIADFTQLNPDTKTEYYIECNNVKSYEFTIAKNWSQRVSVPYAVDFMNKARNDAWLPGATSIAWRDSHQFSYEIPSLVLQYMSNPSMYENMPRNIYKLTETQFENLRVQNEPNLIWLMKYGMEWYYKNNVTDGMNLHPLVKEQLAYFLYIYPYIKEYVSEADYVRFRDMAIRIWGDSSTSNMLKYYQVSGEKSNLFEVQTTVGSIKGSFPPGHSIVPNLLMYEVVKRDGLGGEQQYFDAAYNNCDYILNNWDITDAKYAKGQRMSEHFLMENLAFFQEMYPDKAPLKLKSEITRWADKMIARSDNQWDMRMATSVTAGDAKDYFTGSGWAVGTGVATATMNEPGNEIGMQAIAYAASRVIDDQQKIQRLKEIGDAGRDNMFGRNPFGRTFLYVNDGITNIEGVDLGWFAKHSAVGNGRLGEVPGRIDASPKEASYPFDPKADPGYVEGWVAFNSNWNSALAYTAADDLQITVDKSTLNGGDALNIRLKAPINIDYNNKEKAIAYVTNKSTGVVEKVTLTEEDNDSFYFSGSYTVPSVTSQIEISYGIGLFEVAQTVSVTGQEYKPVTSITLDKNTLSMKVDDVANVTVTEILPTDATYKTVVWSSSDSSVASVDSSGVVTAKTAGAATISASGLVETNVKASCSVNVSPKATPAPTSTPTPSGAIVNLNFNNTPPTDMWGFAKTGTGFDVVQINDPSDDTNKVIQFKGGNTTTVQGYSTFNIPTTSLMKSFNVEFDIFTPLAASGETFIRFTDSNNKDIFSLYSRESVDTTNIIGKTMRYGLNTILGSNSTGTGSAASAKLTTTAETGNVGVNGVWYHISSKMDFDTKKQTLVVFNKSTGAKLIELLEQDIKNSTSLNKLLIGYGYNATTYPGVYIDNFVVSTSELDTPVIINSFTSKLGVINASLLNVSAEKITDAKLYIAQYDANGVMVSIKGSTISVDASATLGYTDNIAIDNQTKNLKLFIFKDNNTLKPLSLSKSIVDTGDTLDLFSMVQPVPTKNQLIDNGYYVWCGSYIKGDDGKYHVFYSRWNKSYGFVPGWVSRSEIAHAVSDNIDGPYVFKEVVLGERDRAFWDGTTQHNPYIIKYNNKYYLYYMGTTAPEGIPFAPSGYGANWYEFRNRQRIGVAVADNINGPWTRFDTPVHGPDTTPNADGTTKWDSMVVNNPALTVMPDGKVLMIYKGVQDTTNGNTSAKNGVVKIGVAIADSPTGPFVKTGGLIFEGSGTLAAEDPFIWYSAKDKKYYAIVRDAGGSFTGSSGALALFESQDGINNWNPSVNVKVLNSNFLWENGNTSVSRVERPWLMFDENEKPLMLFGATRLATNESDTTNVFIPLK